MEAEQKECKNSLMNLLAAVIYENKHNATGNAENVEQPWHIISIAFLAV